MVEELLSMEIVRYANGKKKLILSVNYDKDLAEIAANTIQIIEIFKAAAIPKSASVSTPE